MNTVDMEYIVCFRCGHQHGHIDDRAYGDKLCESCGEDGALTLQESLDLLNDYYLRESQDDE